jgi:hypothetical protein
VGSSSLARSTPAEPRWPNAAVPLSTTNEVLLWFGHSCAIASLPTILEGIH